MNEVKILIPGNCELIKDGNTYIVKEKKQTPPRSWEEFCKRYPVTKDEAIIYNCGGVTPASFSIGKLRGVEDGKCWCSSKEEAQAFLALMQLRQLRKAWVGDWEQPKGKSIGAITYSIDEDKIVVSYLTFWSNIILSFPTQLMANDFLNCFRDLCETAKPLL